MQTAAGHNEIQRHYRGDAFDALRFYIKRTFSIVVFRSFATMFLRPRPLAHTRDIAFGFKDRLFPSSKS